MKVLFDDHWSVAAAAAAAAATAKTAAKTAVQHTRHSYR
jgi:hypothetical protein